MSYSESSCESYERQQSEYRAALMHRLIGTEDNKRGVVFKYAKTTSRVYWLRPIVLQLLPGLQSDILATTKCNNGYPQVKITKKLIHILKVFQTAITKNVPIHPSYWHQLHQAYNLIKRIPIEQIIQEDNSLFYEKEFRLNWKITDNKLIITFGKKHQSLDPLIFKEFPLDSEPGLLEAVIEELGDMWTIVRMRHESNFNDPKGSCVLTWNCYTKDKK